MGGLPSLRAGAGSSPRRASDFLLLRQKKVTKEKATPSLRPLRCATGQTCGGAVARCAVELTSRCALRSDNYSESEHEAWALRRPCHPATAPPQAQPEGMGEQYGPSLRSAPPSRRAAPARWGPSAAMARVAGSLLAVPRSTGRGVCMRVGARMLRALTRCSCLNGARSAQ